MSVRTSIRLQLIIAVLMIKNIKSKIKRKILKKAKDKFKIISFLARRSIDSLIKILKIIQNIYNFVNGFSGMAFI